MSDLLADFKVQIIKQGGLCIAYSHTLDLSTTGKSEAQAMNNFGTIAALSTRGVSKRAVNLDQALLDLGWTKRAKRWSPPVVKARVAS